MRRATTIFTGSGIATASAASALAAFTTLTLVAGGLVISRVMDAEQERSAIALPIIRDALGPMVIGRSEALVRSNVLALDASSSTTPEPLRRASVRADATTFASLVDVDKVRGTVTSALDAEEPGRMEEVGTIERIESIIKNTRDGQTTSDDDSQPTETEAEPAPEEPEERSILGKAVPVVEEVVAVVDEPATDFVYFGTDAGSASPSA